MGIYGIIEIAYFVIGIILAYIWWHDEYEAEYEMDKEEDEESVEDPMAVLFLMGLILFWPFKLIKNYIESFVD